MLMRSLPLRVLAIGFVVLALPLLVDSFLFFQRAYTESIGDAKNNLKDLANVRAHAFSNLDLVRQVLLKEFMVLLDLENAFPTLPNKEMNEKLSKIEVIGPDFEAFVLDTGKEGQYTVLASNRLSSIGAPFEAPLLLRRVLEENTEGEFLRFEFSQTEKKEIPFIYVVRAIISEKTKEKEGILVIASPVPESASPILESVKENDTINNFAILTKEGVIFAATDPDLVGSFISKITFQQRMGIEESKQLGQLPLAKEPLPVITKDDSPFFEFIFRDQVQIAYLTPIPKIGLNFLAYTTKKELFSKSVAHFLFIYTIYGCIFLIGGAITYWLSTWISRPLVQLCSLMERVEKGDLDVRFKEEPLGFELNILGNIFNHTLDTLFENIHKAEDERVLKETYRTELAIGLEVQNNLLPQTVLKVPGLSFESAYIPTKEVGGDFYDLFLKDDTHVALTIADAAGKGISACLYALGVRSLMRTYLTLHDDVGTVLSQTNNMFLEDTDDTGMFVTALMGIYDKRNKILSYYSCGHVPGIVRKRDGQLIKLSHSGMALGLKESIPFKADTLKLESGDILLLFTKGLIDIVNDKYQHFSETRLHRLLQQKKWDTPQEIVRGLTEEVKSFILGTQQDEEISLLCMKVE